MPTGTLTLTNNSTVVKGTGTAFNTELKPGDFIVSVVGGVTYTLPVKTVDSATQATLIKAYDGPTQAGAAWYAVPRDAMNTITAQLTAETAKALRGLNLDKNNWQQVFSGTGNITVMLPDGSTYTGPAWNSFTAALNLKADKTEVDKKANKSDLGNSASRDVGSTVGTVADGNDKRLNTIDGKSGGKLSSSIELDGKQKGVKIKNQSNAQYGGMYAYADTAPFFTDISTPADGYFYPLWASKYFFSGRHAGAFWEGLLIENTEPALITGFTTEGGKSQGLVRQSTEGDLSWIRHISCVSVTQASDRDLKENIEKIQSSLEKVNRLNGVTFNWKKDGYPSAGVIAQDVMEVLPECIASQINPITEERNYAVEYPGLIGLLVEAVKELSMKVEALENEKINK
ncbi:tail fiber domain-containing protein [Serratia marcescens]|nr:tail fiber domain-containing protein [Serratia marcescens]MBH2590968.1 tail fiber domain-containing protein [Serratia marcescens]HAT3712722.1 tail fiber domain-containing protein [Serratia marcescens]HAT3792639.1 tail fiber domain-containing protein [Serratia marcescens]